MQAALLVLDPQNDFFSADNPNLAAFLATVPVINQAISFSRQKGWPIIFVQHISAQKIEGSLEWQIHPSFDAQPTDLAISKKQSNAFWQTELHEHLERLKVDTIFICGYMAEYCVLATYFGAKERAYHPVLLENGIASLSDANTSFVVSTYPHHNLAQLKKEHQ